MNNTVKNITLPDMYHSYVTAAYTVEYGTSGISPGKYYSSADSNIKLVFVFKKQASNEYKFLDVTIQGPTMSFAEYPSKNGVSFLIISLLPIASNHLFNVFPQVLKNRFYMLSDEKRCLTTLLRTLNVVGQLSEAASFIFTFFENVFKKPESQIIYRAVHDIRNQNGNVSIKELADNYFLSQRQFSRKFKSLTSFSPKAYARLVRFEKALEFHEESSSLTELAVLMGYFDQAHFNHEFKMLSGYPPSRFFEITNP